MAIVLKITHGTETSRVLLEDQAGFDAIRIAAENVMPGATATFTNSAGSRTVLTESSFPEFLATARENANGRLVLRLEVTQQPASLAMSPSAQPKTAAAPAESPATPAAAPTTPPSERPPLPPPPPAAGLCGKRIAMMPRGSRGDVQPFVALGSRLVAEGCRVLVLTNTDHVDFVRGFGMEAVGVAANCRKEHESPEFQRALATGDWGPEAAKRERWAREELPGLLKQEFACLESFAPDLIYATPLAEMFAWLYSNLLEVPMVLGSLQPIDEDLSKQKEEGQCAFWWGTFQADLGAMKRVFQEELRDPRFDASWATFWSFRLWKLEPPHPVLVHWSAALNEAPARKRGSVRLTGFLVVEQPEQEERYRSGDSTFGGEALGKLQAFLDAGDRPVYMGWGSIALVSPQHMACLAVRAMRRAGCRGVVLGGWAGLAESSLEGQPDSAELLAYARERVLFVQSAPHEWLFPRCAATVHHGGAGTTAAALRAGVPTIITPMGLDQPGNAQRVQESGCGIALDHFPKVTPEALASALTSCLRDEGMRARCSVMGEILRSEDGVGSTVAEIERFMDEEVSTSLWRARLEKLRERARVSAGWPGPLAGPTDRQKWAAAWKRQAGGR